MDRSLITSAFDIELLIGNRYIEYILLSLSETGSLPLSVPTGNSAVDLFQPADVDRTYEPHEDAIPLTASARSFDSELIFGHPSGGNVKIDLELAVAGQFMTLFAKFGLATGENDVRVLRIEVMDVAFSPGLQSLLDARQITKEEILEDIRAEADRDVPLPFIGAGGDIERIEMRQLPSMDGGPVALAFFLNMRLRNGALPTDFLPDRGDPFAGMNFLEEGQDIAFAVREGFLADLAAHQKFLFARVDANGGVDFPLRENMFDPNSQIVGKLFGVSIEPARVNGQPTGSLNIRLRGEYKVENFFDPDFTFTVTLTPNFDDGVVTWSHTTDLNVPLGRLVAFLLGGFVGLIIFEVAIDEFSGSLVSESQRQQMATFLQALPVRVPIEFLRWDPFYETIHQVVARIDEWHVDHLGIAFSGRAALGRESKPVDHIVLRTEIRNGLGEVDRLAYRVQDHERHGETLDPNAVFPATHRMPSTQISSEPDLFSLFPSEAVDRIRTKRLVGPQDLIPKKVHIDGNQIHRMLCITPREVQEQERIVRDRFRRETRQRIITEQGDAIREQAADELRAELGDEPTPEQVQGRFDQIVEALVTEEFATYVDSPRHGADLDAAVDSVIRLDLSPNEYGLLQKEGIMRIVGVELITRKNRKVRPGTTVLYYRDRPDFDPRDNLLNKARYALENREPD